MTELERDRCKKGAVTERCRLAGADASLIGLSAKSLADLNVGGKDWWESLNGGRHFGLLRQFRYHQKSAHLL